MDPREHATADALANPKGFGLFRKVALTKAVRMTRAFTVETTEGTMDGKAGDYLCLDAKGHPYPCDAEVFHSSYEHVTEGEGG